MSVAKVIEITSGSPKSFEDAVRVGVQRVSETIDEVAGAWVAEQKVICRKGKIEEYRVTLRVSFLLKGKK